MGDATVHVPPSALSYEAALEGLTRIDERQLRAGDFPPLYDSGVRYKREPRDVWRHAVDVFSSGWGDCEDLSAIRAAQLRLSGEDPDAHVTVYQSGPTRYHAIVGRGDGTYEDPSKILGMTRNSPQGDLEGDTDMNDAQADKQARRRIARQCARAALASRRVPLGRSGAFVGVGDDPEPGNDSLTFDLYKSGRGWSGIVRLPTAAGRALFLKTSPGPSKAKAAAKTINLAKMAAKSKTIQALVPPQAKAALALAKSPVGKAVFTGIKKFF
jgi:hypothetical protein